jgi:hypothetical protein
MENSLEVLHFIDEMLAYVEYSEVFQCVSWQSSATDDVKTTQTRL